MRSYSTITFLILLLLSACSKGSDPAATSQSQASQGKPAIRLSRERIPASGWLKVYGTGFSPKHEVTSHLQRPDGTEYAVVPILTDAHGEFTHDIETLLFTTGTYKVWVLDNATGVTSNEAQFESTLESGPAERPIP